jgi:hypothetical protein
MQDAVCRSEPRNPLNKDSSLLQRLEHAVTAELSAQ